MSAATHYIAYLLRLWLAGDGNQPEWRASLEDPRNGQVKGFSTLEEMLEFLREVEKGNQAEWETENRPGGEE